MVFSFQAHSAPESAAKKREPLMPATFASANDLEEKVVTFSELVPGRAYAYTAEGDPNTGVIVGNRGVMVVDAQATPVMARDVIARIRQITDLPITHVLLSHYHAVRVLGASAYGAHTIVASRDTRDLIVERGEQDKASEIARFPRLFRGLDSIPPGLTWPDTVFSGELTVDLGGVSVKISQVGRGHTKGDTIAWLADDKILFAGDLVEYGATPYTGDAYLRDWPQTLANLQRLKPEKLVPGRGAATFSAAESQKAIAATLAFVSDLYNFTKEASAGGRSLNEVYRKVYPQMKAKYAHLVIFEHCMPFDVSRAYDEANGIEHPRIWTAERDKQMWSELSLES
jgi:glyoxylase-like metal-dependent hydrolase (beta-lactamase superfamily II)